ncbi:ADP-ribosylglycohydrolase family protein [Micromonospora aurantiaca (nom. illeg.)]|uniref:ADP-ribosylglycohydrolase family protein n=1 Tax=Micromonospora aurantiaca (nom. illeg.) TaxID=47850 RepID=UPI0033D27B8A
MFGLAYGDALGKETEFAPYRVIVGRYGPGGPMELTGDPALVTDDTQMTLAVGWALRDVEALTPAALAAALRERFVSWSRSPDNNRAPGITCMTACRSLAAGVPWTRATVVTSKGCGANMRVVPVGLLSGLDLDTLAGIAQMQAAMTHGHPTGLAAAELTAYAVRMLRDGAALGELPALLRQRCASQLTTYREDWLGDLWRRARAASPADYIAAGWHECDQALRRLEEAVASVGDLTDPCVATGAGWIAEEALATGLYCAIVLSHVPVAALGWAASGSGDSDSIASIAGALLGAQHGQSAWPEGWAARIEYADQLAALGKGWDS